MEMNMEKTMEKEKLQEKLKQKEKRIKKLVYENIALITENMKLEYNNDILRKRVELLELFSKGYTMKGIAEGEDYAVILVKKEKGRYLN
jgi:hypothetical protein